MLSFEDFLNEKKIPKYQKRGTCVFPHESPKVKDKKDHFPINSESQARNALARAGQTGGKAPTWYDGTYEEFRNAVRKKVKSEYPSIEVTD